MLLPQSPLIIRKKKSCFFTLCREQKSLQKNEEIFLTAETVVFFFLEGQTKMAIYLIYSPSFNHDLYIVKMLSVGEKGKT